MFSGLSSLRWLRYQGSVIGIYLVTLLFVWQVFDPLSIHQGLGAEAITSQQPHLPKAKKPLIYGLPTRIVIKSLKIDLPLDKGYYNKAANSWTLSGTHAQFAMLSTLPNNYGGSTFIYGHNNRFVFANLLNIKPGARVDVYTSKRVFHYLYKEIKVVKPTDVSILSYQGPPVLTLQTCSGNWFQNRHIVRFSYTGYNNV